MTQYESIRTAWTNANADDAVLCGLPCFPSRKKESKYTSKNKRLEADLPLISSADLVKGPIPVAPQYTVNTIYSMLCATVFCLFRVNFIRNIHVASAFL